jgi:hypothetical protein
VADGEYRRLTCMVGACDGTHKAQGYCLRHYRQWQRGGVKEDAASCAHCGAPMPGKIAGSMYCGKRCKRAAWVKANPERYKAMPGNQRKVSAIHTGYCITCGAAYVSRMPRKYCGEDCQPGGARLPRTLGQYYTPPVRTCVGCGLQWSAIRRVGCMRHCPSPECQELRREEVRKARANKSHIDRAKKHGRRYGYFNVLRVFARDRWTCQVCGVKTPKRLRGTMEPNAPELGHIVAISDGGDHVIENCQCECRRCNAAKGVRAQGQLWLAGFADIKR